MQGAAPSGGENDGAGRQRSPRAAELPPDVTALPPGAQVERVRREDGRQLLLFTWDAPA